MRQVKVVGSLMLESCFVMSSFATSSFLPSHAGPATAKVCRVIVGSPLWLTRIYGNNDDVVQRTQAELLKWKVSIIENDCMCQAYSTGSVPYLKVSKSIVMTVC